MKAYLEAAATAVDKAWTEKDGINCTEVCAIIRSALSAQVQDVAIPDGWQLVPKELTEDMKDAHFNENRGRFVAPKAQELWSAMLAAAPAAKLEEKP